MNGMYVWLLLAGLCAYAGGGALVCAALGRVRSGRNEKLPFVSVVIAARNERTNIGSCLESLLAQDYRPDGFEIVVADDRSDDGTAGVLARFMAADERISTVRIDDVPDGVSPKKNAVSRAIGRSRGEVILVTDADCRAGPGWISGMVRRFETGVMMVAGMAPYDTGRGMLDSFVRHEYLWNAGLAAGSTVLGRGTHASARNLAYRREAFEEAGGFGAGAEILSGDDTLLLQAVQKRHPGGVVTEPSSETHVFTGAPESIGAFLAQRMRHMSTGRHFSVSHMTAAAMVYGFHILLLAGIVLAPFDKVVGRAAMFVLGAKIALDAAAALRISRVLHLDVPWRNFIINDMLLVAYMAVMPVFGLFAPGRWKGKE